MVSGKNERVESFCYIMIAQQSMNSNLELTEELLQYCKTGLLVSIVE